jgi:hypothetical protein
MNCLSVSRPWAHRQRVATLGAAMLCAALVACSDTTSTLATTRLPVVRAYLYAGQPVRDISLSWTAPLLDPDSTTDEISPPINDARVALIRSGIRYALVKSSGDSGYYHYAGTDLVVREGDTFDLEVTVDEQRLTARTTVPPRPTGASVSKATLKVPTIDFTSGPPNLDDVTAVARWQRTSGALYYVTLQNTDSLRSRINLTLPGGGSIPQSLFVFPPTDADSLQINVLQLAYYGRYTVRVWRVNQEYAELYATLQQSAADLNEPISNIIGGLGVFSAFASDSASISVVR